MSETKPLYSGEAVLLNWHDAKSGRKIVLQLEKYAPGAHPFDGLDGERFAVVIVGPLAPAEHAAPKNIAGSSKGRTSDFDSDSGGSTPPPASKPKRRWSEMPPSQRAALLCGDDEFQRWATLHHTGPAFANKESVTAWLKEACGVSSRAQLDGTEENEDFNPHGLARFRKFESDFRAWRQARGHGVI